MTLGPKRDLTLEYDNFKGEIHTMLIAFGCKEAEAVQMINSHEEQISMWVNGRKGPIVTSAVAARIIIKNCGMRLHE